MKVIVIITLLFCACALAGELKLPDNWQQQLNLTALNAYAQEHSQQKRAAMDWVNPRELGNGHSSVKPMHVDVPKIKINKHHKRTIQSSSKPFFNVRSILKFMDKWTEFPASLYASNPNYWMALSVSKGDAYTANYVNDDIVVVGYEGVAGLAGNLTTWFVSYNTSQGTLNNKSVIPAPVGFSSQISTATRVQGTSDFLAISSSYRAFGGVPGCPPGICISSTNQIIYKGNEQGLIDPTPVETFPLWSLSPFHYNFTIAYNGILEPAPDGLFAPFTYSFWTVSPFALGGQKLGIFGISNSAPRLTPLVEVTFPSTGVAGRYYFPQFGKMYTMDNGKYLVQVNCDSYNVNLFAGVFVPLDTPSAVLLYVYDSISNTLTLVGNAPQATILQGGGIDPDLRVMVALTNPVGNKTVLLNPDPIEDDVPDPENNIRWYNVNKKCFDGSCNALEYVSSTNNDGSRCWNGVFSPDGSLFAYLCQGGYPLLNTVPPAIPNVFVGNISVQTPGEVFLLSFNNNNGFVMHNKLTTSVLPIAMAFSPDSTKLIVSGSDNPRVAGTELIEVADN